MSEVLKWFADRGDSTLRLDYPLTRESIVVDLGGYEGSWTAAIHARYGCRVHVFEPVPGFCESIRKRFAGDPGVTVHCCGLAASDGEVELVMSADGTGVHASGSSRIPVRMRSVHDFMDEIGSVDLMKVNIEGGEYDLLDAMTNDELSRAVDLQVQFHSFYPDAVRRRERIRERLRRTHRLTYNYDFVWENWTTRT